MDDLTAVLTQYQNSREAHKKYRDLSGEEKMSVKIASLKKKRLFICDAKQLHAVEQSKDERNSYGCTGCSLSKLLSRHVDTPPSRGGADFYFRPEGGGGLTFFAHFVQFRLLF